MFSKSKFLFQDIECAPCACNNSCKVISQNKNMISLNKKVFQAGLIYNFLNLQNILSNKFTHIFYNKCKKQYNQSKPIDLPNELNTVILFLIIHEYSCLPIINEEATKSNSCITHLLVSRSLFYTSRTPSNVMTAHHMACRCIPLHQI